MEASLLKQFVRDHFAKIYTDIAEPYLPRSDFQDERGATTTVKPTVIIGLGGSGTKSVARLKWRIQEFYRGEQFEGERKSLAFLTMDTLAYDNLQTDDPDAARFIYPVISRDDYIYLGGFNPGRYLQTQKQLSPDLQKWWDDRYAPPQSDIVDGAKRVRELGRLALYRNKDLVRTSIRNAANRVVEIHAGLVNQGKVKGLGQEAANIYFYIYSGTCGGTGSGSVLDVLYQCYTVAAALGKTPVIRLMLFMPRLFVESARRKPNGEWFARAYEANAYAFFKELQHLVSAGESIYDWRFDAKEMEGQDFRPYPRWKPERVYLIDTEIAGKEIGVNEFNQIYTLAADYSFQLLVSPVGANLESSQATNIDQALDSFSAGRPNAFSSAGISYIVFPSKTIARCLSSRLLKDALYYFTRVPLSDAEKKAVPQQAEEIYLSLGDQLNPLRVDETLLSGADLFVKAVPDGSQLIRRMEQENIKASELLQRAEDIGEEQELIGKSRVDQNFDDFKHDALRELGKQLEEIAKAKLAQGIEMIKATLSELKSRVEEARSTALPAPSHQAERQAKEAIERVRQLEQRFWVWKKKSKIEDEVNLASRKLREETDLTIRAHAAERRQVYLNEALTVLASALAQAERVQSTGVALGNEMDERSKDCTIEFDETSVSITTQYIPVAPTTRGALEKLYDLTTTDVKGFTESMLAEPALKESLWKLGAPADDQVKEALDGFVRQAFGASIERIGRPWLKQKVTDRIVEDWKDNPDSFQQSQGQNLLNLADPSWALTQDDIPQKERRVTSVNAVCAYPKDNFPKDRYLPQDLRGDAFPGDPRMMIVLQSQHAAPLFAVRGIMMYREVYRRWLRDFQGAGEAPPHISREWNREDALEDIAPKKAIGTEEQEAFAQGLFTDWLVREKKEPNLLAVIAGNEPAGPLYIKGTRGNYFYRSYEQRPDGKLYVRGEVDLKSRVRNEAAQAMDSAANSAVESFVTKVEDILSAAALRPLVGEYLDFLRTSFANLPELILVSERERDDKIRNMPDDRQRSLYRQLVKEFEIIEQFRAELEGV